MIHAGEPTASQRAACCGDECDVRRRRPNSWMIRETAVEVAARRVAAVTQRGCTDNPQCQKHHMLASGTKRSTACLGPPIRAAVWSSGWVGPAERALDHWAARLGLDGDAQARHHDACVLSNRRGLGQGAPPSVLEPTCATFGSMSSTKLAARHWQHDNGNMRLAPSIRQRARGRCAAGSPPRPAQPAPPSAARRPLAP
jgi:hypothetical protein